MNSIQHQNEVQRCKTGIKIAINESNEDLLHATIGVATESGELLDAVKKHIFYGKKLDIVNLQEEVGDVLWYLNLLCAWMGTTLEEQMQNNSDKLRIRYPEKFEQKQALERNVREELKHFDNKAFENTVCSRCHMDRTSCIC